MARTVEETIMSAVIGAFAGSGKVQNTNPEKSYMAFATSIPKAGEHYHCNRVEKKSDKEINVRSTETTTVQNVQKLASNVYVATTRNSYYVTQILGMPEENVQFAVVESVPQVGHGMNCHMLRWSKSNGIPKAIRWNTTVVQEVKFINGLYKVKTMNTTYVCFPMM